MVKISCHTNIDCARGLQWPTELPERPQVGDLIRSRSSTNTKHIELAVCGCTWFWDELSGQGSRGVWVLRVELHLPPHRLANIPAFEKFVKEPR